MQCNGIIGKITGICLLALFLGGCTATYVPISWGMGEKVNGLSRSDLTLAILFNRYDPDRKTLRVSGESYNEVMMPGDVKYHLGAYRRDAKQIYRNLFNEYNDQQLRDVMVHELSHHIWFHFMTSAQQVQWGEHLEQHPTPLRDMVRRVYPDPSQYDTEDFAFTVEFARQTDIEQLARMNLITQKERDDLLAQLKPAHPPMAQQAAPPLLAADPGPSPKGAL